MNSQLFQIQESITGFKKRKKKKDPKTTVVKEEKKPVAASVAMGYYDDLGPIQLSGSFGVSYNFSHQTDEYNESVVTEDAAFSIVDDEGNDVNRETYQQPEFYASQHSDDDRPVSFGDEYEEEDGISESRSMSDDIAGSLSDMDIARDLSSIMNAESTPAENAKKYAAKKIEEDDFYKKMMDRNNEMANATPSEEAAETPAPSTNNQSIFDAIAKSLNYANAFDLGDYVLEQRFDMFDDEEKKKEEEAKNKQAASNIDKQTTAPANTNTELPPETLSTKDFVEDLDIIGETYTSFSAAPDKTSKNWPAAPAGLAQPDAAKTKQLFGEFEFEELPGAGNCAVKIKGNWESTNIEEVDIPQLKGKTNGTTKKEITKGVIWFNKKAKKQLQRLWKAWEDAGLLDRILTFDGAFVARHIKRKDGTCATSLSNHAWGSAFDINADWNSLGSEPALVGQKGCTRELVEIAAQHGFYWGGHFTTKDGMHFEVAKIID